MIIKINNLKEAEDFIEQGYEIVFLNKKFYRLKDFENFIKEIETGCVLQIPKDAESKCFYTNFGQIFSDKLIITKQHLLFFNEEELIIYKEREYTDDVEYSYLKRQGKTITYCSGNPIVYDSEQDKQFINLHPIQ